MCRMKEKLPGKSVINVRKVRKMRQPGVYKSQISKKEKGRMNVTEDLETEQESMDRVMREVAQVILYI